MLIEGFVLEAAGERNVGRGLPCVAVFDELRGEIEDSAEDE